MKKNIGYIGYSIDVIETLYYSACFELKYIFVQANRVTNLIRLFSMNSGITLYIVNDADDLHEKILNHYKEIECCLMYDCGIIVKEKTINIIDIYNVHPGDLKFNRGNNPLEYSILNKDKYMTVSLHRISSRIDMGTLIYSWEVPIGIRDSLLSLEQKLYDMVPQIVNKLNEYLGNKIQSTTIITEGIYNKKMCSDIVTIDINKDTAITIYNKLRAAGYDVKKNKPIVSEAKPMNEQFNPWYNKGAIIIFNSKKFNVLDVERIEFKDIINTDENNISHNNDKYITIQKGRIKFILIVEPEKII